MLTRDEETLLAQLIDSVTVESVSPKMEQFRGFPKTYMGVRGGRGAGGKSTGCVSLLVQEANVEKHNYVMLREIQNSLDDSVYPLIEELYAKFGYTGWEFTRSKGRITTPSGSKFIFKGLKDMRSSHSLKGLHGFDRGFIDEAAHVSRYSIIHVLPTLMRNSGAKLLFAYNPESPYDAITELVWDVYKERPDMGLMVEVRPGALDNPWWSTELEELSSSMKIADPDEWLHTFGGHCWVQGEHSVLSRVGIQACTERNIKHPEGVTQIGVDVARSMTGDLTVMYKRHGMKVIDQKAWKGQDLMTTADEAWKMAGQDPTVRIVVDDTGIGAGVSDRLTSLGAKVIRFVAGGNANDRNKYNNATSEMWHEFPIDEADIPDDVQLVRQLTGRQYAHDNKGRRTVESKDIYKKRLKTSPDKADALLLCFLKDNGGRFSTEFQLRMAQRNNGGF